MRNKIAAILTVLMIAGMLAACQGVAPAGNNQIPMLNVTGTGKVYLVPDIAYVYIGVRSQAADVATALNQNNSQANAIASTLQEKGVAAEDIQTSAFNVYPQQQYSPEGQPTEITYVVENTMFITVRDLQNLGGLLDAVVRAGANTINGISFDVEDRAAAEKEARRLAIEDAQAKAAELAQLSGVELGQLYSVNVYSSGVTPMYEAKGGLMASSAAPIAAGQMVIQMDATLSYAIK